MWVGGVGPVRRKGGQLLYRNVQRFRDGLVCKAHRLLYHSTLGLRVKKKKRRVGGVGPVRRKSRRKRRGVSLPTTQSQFQIWHLRLIDSCIAQLQAQGPCRTCNESTEEGEEEGTGGETDDEVRVEGCEREGVRAESQLPHKTVNLTF